jgi:cadmium resistance protein CadD (predicted permease)
MRICNVLAFCPLLFLSAAVAQVDAADETFFDQFLGSPLLVLVSLIIIVIVAFVYRRIKK